MSKQSWPAPCPSACVVRLVAAGVMCGLVAARAEATTITLNLNSLPAGNFTTPVIVDGFKLSPVGGNSSSPTIENVAGTAALGSSDNIFAGGADTILTMVGGGTFTLLSVQAAALNGDTGNFAFGIGVPGGASLTYGTRFGRTLTTNPTTEILPTGFQNITAVDLDPVNTGDNDVIENITVSVTAVPEPGSVALLATGVVGVGLLRRNKTARSWRQRINARLEALRP